MTIARSVRRPAKVLRGALSLLVMAAAAGGSHAADVAKPVRMWDCSYIAVPEPAIHCELSALARTDASSTPLWDAEAAAPDRAIDIPLFSVPRQDRIDRLMGLAQEGACGGEADCYVTWRAPAPR